MNLGGVDNVTVRVDISFKILQKKRNIKVNKQRSGNFRMGKGLYDSSALWVDLRNVEIYTIFTETIMHHNFQGNTVFPSEIGDNGYAKFRGVAEGVNKVHYCLGDNGELPSIPHKIRIRAALSANTTLSARVFRLLLLFRWFYASSPRAPSSFRCRRRAFFQFWLL